MDSTAKAGLLLIFVLASSLPGNCQLPILSKRVYPKNECVPDALAISTQPWIVDDTPDTLPTPWLRLHFTTPSAPARGEVTIHIFDQSGKEVSGIQSDNFGVSKEGSFEAWSPQVAIDHPHFIVEHSANAPKVCLDRYNYRSVTPGAKAIVGGHDKRENLLKIYGKNHRFYKFSSPIGAIFFQNQDGDDTCCTGFAIAARYLLTNYHCISDVKQLRTAEIIFHLDSEDETHVTRRRPVSILSQNESLDYSLLSLDSDSETWVKWEDRDFTARESLILIQHPDGLPKEIAVIGCRFERPDSDRPSNFFHLCDSSGGSSGSAIMDNQTGIVLGIHHLAQTDPATQDWHNLGVRIGAVLKDIQVQNMEAYKAIQNAAGSVPQP